MDRHCPCEHNPVSISAAGVLQFAEEVVVRKHRDVALIGEAIRSSLLLFKGSSNPSDE